VGYHLALFEDGMSSVKMVISRKSTRGPRTTLFISLNCFNEIFLFCAVSTPFGFPVDDCFSFMYSSNFQFLAGDFLLFSVIFSS